MAALAQVVRARVHDDRPTEDALRPNQLDLPVRHGPLGVALAVRFEIAQVPDVALAVRGGPVGFGERVDCKGGGRRVLARLWCERGGGWVTVGSGARAAVGVVAELVHVHAALGGGVVAGDVVGDGGRGGLGGLLEGDGPADFGVAAEDCHCCGWRMISRV